MCMIHLRWRPGNRRKPAWTAISQKGVHFRGLSIGSPPENSFAENFSIFVWDHQNSVPVASVEVTENFPLSIFLRERPLTKTQFSIRRFRIGLLAAIQTSFPEGSSGEEWEPIPCASLAITGQARWYGSAYISLTRQGMQYLQKVRSAVGFY